MPQVFPKSMNVVSRVSALGVPLLLALGVVSGPRSTARTTRLACGPWSSSRCRSATSTTSAGSASIAAIAIPRRKFRPVPVSRRHARA